jgi:hypothetical protein
MQEWGVIAKLPVMNLGLLFGTGKSESSHALEKTIYGTHEAQRDSLHMRAHDWVEGFPEDRDLMMSVFLRYWKDIIGLVPKEVSYWVHPKFGGLGLPVTREVQITMRQRKLAAYLYLEGDRLKGLSQPVPEFTMACMQDWSKRMRTIKYEQKPGGRYHVDGFRLLRFYLGLGYAASDPAGLGAYKKCFERYWKESRSHWSKPLSFRHCVGGPTEPLGGLYPLGISIC